MCMPILGGLGLMFPGIPPSNMFCGGPHGIGGPMGGPIGGGGPLCGGNWFDILGPPVD
uniref:Uncharacterized protein n=1 Tax=Ciona savignyi TaxID=51511 RepID=H2Z7K4_CIOSA